MKGLRIGTMLLLVAGVVAITGSAFAYFFSIRKPPSTVQTLVVAATVDLKTPPKFITNIVGKTPETEMKAPLGVTVADNGRIFVADTDNARIQAYDPNGQFLFQFGKGLQGAARIERPVTVAWHSGRLYVGDIQRNAILLFDGSGNFDRSILGKDLGINLSPLAFTFDGDTLYVASAPGYVYAISPDGKLLKTLGEPGGPEGYLGYPNGLAVANNQIIIADSNNQRIQVFDMDGKLLQVKTNLNFSLPRGMTVDRLGRLFVVDTFGNRVVALDKELNQLFSFGERGLEEGQFDFPNQIATDAGGRLYIADRENNRIAVFGY